MDLQRDFTVASPAEFVTRFGGNRVIEKVRMKVLLVFLNLCFSLFNDITAFSNFCLSESFSCGFCVYSRC